MPSNFLFRYDIGNCLFEAAYDEVLDKCLCTPYYHWGVVDLPTILEKRPFCKVNTERSFILVIKLQITRKKVITSLKIVNESCFARDHLYNV